MPGEWFEGISPTLTIDAESGKVPLREHTWIKESPSLDHFVEKAFKTNSEVGRRIPVTKVEKPEQAEEWRKNHLPKLREAGLLPTPPSDPKEYGITKPENLVAGVNWSDERAGKFAELGVKHGLTKEAMAEFLELHRDAVGGTQAVLNTSLEQAELEFKREFGDKSDEVKERVKRFIPLLFKTPEELAFFEESGIANHPIFNSVMGRLSAFASQDSSLSKSLGASGAGGSKMTGAEVTAKVAAIRSDVNNPHHKLYWQKDAATLKMIEDMYKEAYGEGQVQIGGAVNIQKA